MVLRFCCSIYLCCVIWLNKCLFAYSSGIKPFIFWHLFNWYICHSHSQTDERWIQIVMAEFFINIYINPFLLSFRLFWLPTNFFSGRRWFVGWFHFFFVFLGIYLFLFCYFCVQFASFCFCLQAFCRLIDCSWSRISGCPNRVSKPKTPLRGYARDKWG